MFSYCVLGIILYGLGLNARGIISRLSLVSLSTVIVKVLKAYD